MIVTGLGMRESSGGSDIGRDTSANNVTADTAEAGPWQQSWGSRRASPEIAKLASRAQGADNFAAIFREGVKLRPGAMDNFGDEDSDGWKFQQLCKTNPAFAAQVAAIGLRTLYNEWGPIIRREAELRPEAIALFRKVESIVGAVPPVIDQKPATSWISVLVAALMALFRRGPGVSPPVPVPAHPANDAPWMPVAIKEIGFHEIGQNQGTEKYVKGGKCGAVGDPYCAIFANFCLETVGIRGTRSAMARSFEHSDQFVRLAGPAYGAITTLWRGSPGSGLGHVFFYAGENARGILALGGNQSDQVCRQYEPRNRVVGYFWPKSQPLPKIGKIIVNEDANEGTET